MKLEFSGQIFGKSSNIKFHENPSSGNQFVPCGRRGRHHEANSPFLQFCERTWKRKIFALFNTTAFEGSIYFRSSLISFLVTWLASCITYDIHYVTRYNCSCSFFRICQCNISSHLPSSSCCLCNMSSELLGVWSSLKQLKSHLLAFQERICSMDS
jgi:hypothetical protein